MALLYRSVTLARMWTILEAHTAFTDLIQQARRIKGDAEDGWLKRLVHKAPHDFPSVDLGFGPTFSGGPIPFNSFAQEGTTPTATEWVEERRADFRLRILYSSPKQAEDDYRDALEMECIEAFENAGRNLGLEYIRAWGPWRGQYGSAQRGNLVHPMTEIIIPVTYEFAGSQV